MRPLHLLPGATLIALTLIGAAPAVAQPADASQYPSRAVRIIVGGGPGTPADVRARQIAQKLSAAWAQPVIVENRPGAGGQLALDQVVRAAPDGHTLGLAGNSTLTIIPHLRKLPFDPEKDVAPVARIGYAPILLLVNAALPVSSARELIAHARSRPGELNAATWGDGTLTHLALVRFSRANGVNIRPVPYPDGGGRAVTELLAGEVQIAFEFLHLTRGHIKTGRLKALAVSGNQRLSAYPDIPTFAEAGVSGMDDVAGWLGFVAPTGTPAALLEKIHAGVERAFEDQEILRQTLELGAFANVTSPLEFGKFLKEERARWGRTITENGIRLE